MNLLAWLSEPVLGLALALLAAGLMFAFSLPAVRKRARALFRPMRPMQRLRRAIGLSVEDGSRLHVSIGQSSIASANSASALVGLNTVERIGMLSSASDRPPVATSGDGTLAILSQDSLHSAYRVSSLPEQYDPIQARLTGPTPFSYVAGALPVIHDERVSTNVLVGHFGPEAALLADAAEQEDAFTLAASDSLAAQAALYVAAQEPLIGEELFAIPAYLQASPVHQAGLRAQDVLRWVVIAALIVGSIGVLLFGGL